MDKQVYELIKLYILGGMPIVDRKTSGKKVIKHLDDLSLLSIANIKSKSSDGEHLNHELYKAFNNIRNSRIKFGTPNWGGVINSVFNEVGVESYFGCKPEYEVHVSEYSGNKLRGRLSEADKLAEVKKYVMGELPIVDIKTSGVMNIQGVDDLFLLSKGNIIPRNKITGSPNLKKIYGYTIDREGLPYFLESLFADPDVIKHLGCKASYKENVNQNKIVPYKDYKDRLRKYILGEKLIVDRNTKKAKKITEISDLELISHKNMKSKNSKLEFINHDLWKLYNSISSCISKEGAKNWRKTLNDLFEEKDVQQYLGGEATYEDNVKPKRTLKVPKKIDRPMEKYIPTDLIPLWVDFKSNGSLSAKDKLREYYMQNVVIRIAGIILRRNYKLRTHYGTVEELAQLAYTELDKKIDAYDISIGIRFDSYVYRSIHGRIIDELRKEKIMQKSILERKINARSLGYEEEKNIPDFYKKTGLPLDFDMSDFELLTKGMHPRAKHVLIGRVQEGKNHRQIAMELDGISIPAVSKWFSKAKKTLRANYERLYANST